MRENTNPTPTPNQEAVDALPATEQKVISWIPYWDQEAAIRSFKENKDVLDFVSVFWYGIDSTGNIRTYSGVYEDPTLINFAHQNNIKVLALVANLPDHTESAEWDPKRADKVIATERGRKKHIASLLELVKEGNFDGIDIDYEALRRDQRENFSVFIEELSTALHNEGKILGVAIHPKTGEYKPEEDNGSHAQDLQRLAKSADQLYFMTYLEHGTFSQPGSIGSLPWIQQIIRFAVSDLHVPRKKIFLGIGSFGVQWKKEKDRYTGVHDDLTFGEIVSLVNEKRVPVMYDDTAKSAYITYIQDGAKYIVWFENADTIKPKIALAKDYGLGGIAFWRLNSEDPNVWELFR